jgi:prephenate dehydratase
VTCENLDTFSEVFNRLTSEGIDGCMCAIENSLYGSIHDVYDLMLRHHFWISGEIYLPIHHQLIGLPGAKLSDIKEIHSQAPALGQCEQYLDKHFPDARRIEQHDTAASVAMVKEWSDPTKAAIASSLAADIHGLHILSKNIEDHKENYTRFVALQAHQPETLPPNVNKTSLALTTAHHSGALYHALGAFSKENINLSKLESRHIAGERWKYMFYIDVEAGVHEQRFQRSLATLAMQGCTVRVLGSYRRASFDA